jgi:putative solute:sodium symporter small subunit
METTTLLQEKQGMLSTANNQAYLDLKVEIEQLKATLTGLLGAYTGLQPGSLEATILSSSLQIPLASNFQDPMFKALPDMMSYYLTHNQSFLTDTPFLGFPFHYFYTAVFLLVLFVVLCIVYKHIDRKKIKKGACC